MLLTIIIFFLVLGLVVLVHEAGHFFVARILGVKVEEFGFGFPPRLVGFYKNEENKIKWVWGAKFPAEVAPHTVYSINKIPIGGFVKIKGEDGSYESDKDSFITKKPWQKTAVLTAGVLGNFLLCIVLFSIGFYIGLPTALDDKQTQHLKEIKNSSIQVVSINVNSPAETAGIKIGDVILALDDKDVQEVKAIQNYTAQKNNLIVNVKVKRNNDFLNLEVVPTVLESSSGKAVMGVGLVHTATISYGFWGAIWQGLTNTFSLIGAICVAFFDLIKNIFTTGQISADLSGPVGILMMTGQVTQLGWVYVLQFVALLSVNLGIINILPFPALDGGRIVFVIIEKIRGRGIKRKTENIIHTVGYVCLMILIVMVTYRDVVRWGGTLINKIFNL